MVKKKAAKLAGEEVGKNVFVEVEDGILTLRMDLSKDFGKSKTGKSDIVATTSGIKPLDAADGIKLGVNLFR